MLNSLGKYLLAGGLSTLIGYSAAEAQTIEQDARIGAKLYEILFGKSSGISEKTVKVNPIYARGELTVAGNGIFLTSYTNPSMPSNDGSYDLTEKFSSKDKITYSALTSNKIKQILDNSEVKPSVRDAINAIRRRMAKNSGTDYNKFNSALKDGKLKSSELKGIREGIFAYLVTTGKQAVVGFFEVRGTKPGKLERKAEEKTGKLQLPNKVYEVFAPKDSSDQVPKYQVQKDTSKVDSGKVSAEKAVVDSSKIKAEQEFLKKVSEAEERMLEERKNAKDLAGKTSKDSSYIPNYVPERKDTAQVSESPKITEKEARREEFYEEDLLPRDSTKVSKIIIKPKKSGEVRRNEIYLEDIEEITPKDSTIVFEEKTASEISEIMKKKRAKGLCTRFGLEGAIAFVENEANIGAFVDVPLNSWLSVGGYGDYFFRKGKSTYSDLGTSIIQREKQLIGSETYRQRTDDIHTTAEERAIADIGAGISFKINDDVEFPLRIGAGLMQQEKTLDGKSTITFERNNPPLQEPSIITNTKTEGPVTKSALSLSASLRFNLFKDFWTGFSYNRIGKKDIGRLNFMWRF